VLAWWLAVRPKTLPASATPVLVGTALAWSMGSLRLPVALLCGLFAVLGQIAANLANDYGDGVRGIDGADRLGPARAVASGWISPTAMRRAVGLVVAAMLAVGAALIARCGWWAAGVAAVCAAGALLYTGGPWPLAYHGWGDALVLVFFGWVAVGVTCFAQTGAWAPSVGWAATAVGLATDAILTVNNYRDREADRRDGKRTLVARWGEPFGRRLYLADGLLAGAACLALLAYGGFWAALLPQAYLAAHVATWRRMVRVGSGRALNPLLGETARNLLLLGLLLCLGIALDGRAGSLDFSGAIR
jgi:1,4-dihydroxy-2-naphthoate octaprenyltransferase